MSQSPVTVQQRPRPNEITTRIGAPDRVRGELHVGGCARIDGVVRGSIERASDTSRAILGPGGHIRGEIRVHSIWIDGEVVGPHPI